MPVRVARDVPAKHVTLSSTLNGISSYSLQPTALLWPIGPVWSGRCPVTAKITGSNPVWVAKKFELGSQKFEISHFELPISNFIWCGTPTAERLFLEASVCGFESRLRH